MRVATAHPAAVPAARAAEPAASGRSPRTTVRPASSAATSTTSSRCPARPDRHRRRRRDRQGRARGPGHGPDALDPARRGAASDSPGDDPRPRERAARARDAGPHVRDLPVRDPRARDRADRDRQRRPQPALRPHRRRRHRAARDGHAARPACPASRTRRPRASSARATQRPALLRRARRGPRPGREMYGFPRLREAMAIDDAGSELLDRLLDDAPRVHRPRTGSRRTTSRSSRSAVRRAWPHRRRSDSPASRPATCRRRGGSTTRPLSRSRRGAGNERAAMDRVAEAVAPLGLEPARLERLKTAVSETAMNAIEYGSQGDPAVPVDVVVDDDDRDDRRPHHRPRPVRRRPDDAEMPDIDAQARGRPEAARLGPLPDHEHGGFDGRDQRRADPDGDPDDGPRGRDSDG